MRNTGVICMVVVPSHDPDTCRYVDMGNYFDHEGQQVLVTSREMAVQYGHLVDVPIYVRRARPGTQGNVVQVSQVFNKGLVLPLN